MDSQSGHFKLQFGKHRFKTLKDVPIQYVRWLATHPSDIDNGLTTKMAQEYLMNCRDPYIASATPIEIRLQECLMCKSQIMDMGFILMLRLPKGNRLFFAHSSCIDQL
jgi:hypothetical protein